LVLKRDSPAAQARVFDHYRICVLRLRSELKSSFFQGMQEKFGHSGAKAERISIGSREALEIFQTPKITRQDTADVAR
jgi:hypothetical protein